MLFFFTTGIKETFKMMLEDLDRKTKTIELQSKNQQEFTKTMLKLKQQAEKATETTNQYKLQVEKRDLEIRVSYIYILQFILNCVHSILIVLQR